jgi:hypothetical protein
VTCKAAYKKKYNETDKGRATNKKYEDSDERKKSRKEAATKEEAGQKREERERGSYRSRAVEHHLLTRRPSTRPAVGCLYGLLGGS